MERPPVKLETHEAPQMKRSKLEIYVDIIKVLAHTGPLNKSSFNGNIHEKYLDFLIKQGFVEERTIKKKSTVLAVTQRGLKVLKYFEEPSQKMCVLEK